MAALAGRAGVFACQRKTGHGGVIKPAFLPIVSLMATGAIVSQLALVDIVAAMATDAGLRQPRLATRRMAAFACDTQVFAGEGESGQAVIKFSALPAVFVVAILALQTERPFVVVVGPVAAFASAWRLPERMFTLMALHTLSRRHLVGAAQQEVGLAVVKTARIQWRHVGVATAVFKMAGAARLRRQPAMKTGSLLDVDCHRFVATQTTLILGILVELDMALTAVGLNFGMITDDRPRHQCRLQRVSSAGNRRQQRQQGWQ